MPLKDRKKRAAYLREWRKRKREANKPSLPGMDPNLPDDPAGAIEQFCREKLIVPPGHPLAGSAMELEPFALAFLRDVFKPGITEGLLCCARKQGKSSLVGNTLLSFLADNGPMRQRGFRAGVLSQSKEKANELKMHMQTTAEASKLKGLNFLRSPAPGRIESRWGSLDLISTDSGAHNAGFSLVVVDDIGFLEERHRDLIASVRSAVSARAGLFLSMSAIGDGPFIPEILERRGVDEGLTVHLYQADPDAALDDREAWKASNPALGTIKQWSYMESEARRVAVTVKDQSLFRALDLNQPATPGTETLVALDDWNACVTDDPPNPAGDCYVGIDMGGSKSLTSVSIFFPESRLLETIAGLPAHPDLKTRAQADNSPYLEMERRGELIISGEFTTDPAPLIAHVARRLKDYRCKVLGAAADLYRKNEVIQSMSDAGVKWKMDWRRTGSGPDGIEDVRFFRKAVADKAIVSGPSLLMAEAIRGSIVRKDEQANPVLNKRKSSSRIDPLSATILCVGAATRESMKPKRTFQHVAISLEQLGAR